MYIYNMETFKLWLVRNGRKESTIRNHIRRLRYLSKNIDSLTVENVDAFVLQCLSKNLRHSSINAYIDTIKVWGHAFNNKDLQNYKHLKNQAVVKGIMSDEEIERFLMIENIKGCSSEMNTIFTRFWTVWAYTGMRGGEVANLYIQDVDLGSGVFIVRDSKTNHSRYVPIAKNLYPMLEDIAANNKGLLFKSTTGKKLNDKTWGRNFHQRIKILGISREGLTPYSLRHSFITRLLEEDVNLYKVQKIVGHRKVETTAKYTHLTQKDIKKALNKHPLIQKHLGTRVYVDKINDLVQVLQTDSNIDIKFETNKNTISLEVCIHERT